MTELEGLFREVLIFIGDVNRMDIRLSRLREKAKHLGVEIEDIPSSEQTINRIKKEANVLHDKINDKLDGES